MSWTDSRSSQVSGLSTKPPPEPLALSALLTHLLTTAMDVDGAPGVATRKEVTPWTAVDALNPPRNA
jgi:hypothetical protein